MAMMNRKFLEERHVLLLKQNESGMKRIDPKDMNQNLWSLAIFDIYERKITSELKNTVWRAVIEQAFSAIVCFF